MVKECSTSRRPVRDMVWNTNAAAHKPPCAIRNVHTHAHYTKLHQAHLRSVRRSPRGSCAAPKRDGARSSAKCCAQYGTLRTGTADANSALGDTHTPTAAQSRRSTATEACARGFGQRGRSPVSCLLPIGDPRVIASLITSSFRFTEVCTMWHYTPYYVPITSLNQPKKRAITVAGMMMMVVMSMMLVVMMPN